MLRAGLCSALRQASLSLSFLALWLCAVRATQRRETHQWSLGRPQPRALAKQGLQPALPGAGCSGCSGCSLRGSAQRLQVKSGAQSWDASVPRLRAALSSLWRLLSPLLLLPAPPFPASR